MAMVHEKMIAVMKAMTAVEKNERNDFQKYNFRGIDAVMNVLHPLLAENGLVTVPQVIDRMIEVLPTGNGKSQIHVVITYSFRLCAEDGSMSEPCIMVGEGLDTGDKACNKAMAVAMKYALFQMFCIPTEEMRKDDPDNYSPEIGDTTSATPANPATVTKSAKVYNYEVELERIKQSFGVDKKGIATMRDTLIQSGEIEDIPSDKMTEDDWKKFTTAIWRVFGKQSA